MALQRGIRIHQYLDDWLVRACPTKLSPGYTDLGSSLSRTRLAGKQGKVRTGPKTGFQLRRLPVRPQGGQGQTHTRALADLNRQDLVNPVQSGEPSPAVHVPHRPSNSHRKASPPRSTSYETHTVALEKQLEGTRITGKGKTSPQVVPPLKVVAGGKQYAFRSTITPTETCSTDIYRCIKRRVGHSLKRKHCKGNLVHSRKQVAHKSFRDKSGFSGHKRFPRPLFKQHSPGSHRQHNSGSLYQQRGGGMKSGSLYAILWRILSWCKGKQITLKARHIPGLLNVKADKLPRLGQTIQPELSLHPVVFQAICSRWHQPQVNLFAIRFNNELLHFVSPVPDSQA